MEDLKDEVALVTGASRGIGRAIATMLAQRGAKVVGTATSTAGAEAISAYFKESGLNGQGMVLDVNDKDGIGNLIKQVTESVGTISILVNNAGITKDNLLMRMSDEEWEAVITTNLSSVFQMTKAILRDMLKLRKGRIINIASVVGASGNAGQTNYAAAKAGMFGFTKSLAREVAARGITVNAVAPGFIDTDMTKVLKDEHKEALKKQIPLGRLGEADDIANAVTFLASPAAAYITGETLHVNGGMYMH